MNLTTIQAKTLFGGLGDIELLKALGGSFLDGYRCNEMRFDVFTIPFVSLLSTKTLPSPVPRKLPVLSFAVS
jgi:hypothetical protein